MVVHGAIDGYSRKIMFLSCSGNNRAATVLNNFFKAVEQHGLPSRVCTDQGTIHVKPSSPGRGSFITGPSVHNQRIEKLWRDLFVDCLYIYYSVFFFHGRSGLLKCKQ